MQSLDAHFMRKPARATHFTYCLHYASSDISKQETDMLVQDRVWQTRTSLLTFRCKSVRFSALRLPLTRALADCARFQPRPMEYLFLLFHKE